MIDHLLIAPDRATLIAAIAAIGAIVPAGAESQPLWFAGDAENPAGWRSDVAFAVSITDNSTMVEQVITNDDGSTSTIQVPSTLTDYHLWVALPAEDPALSALPNCILVADRDAANAGRSDFILQTSLTQEQMSHYAISPVVAGSSYPFGGG